MWFVFELLSYTGVFLVALALFLDYLYRRLRLHSKIRRNQTQKDVEAHSVFRFYYCALIQACYMSPGVFYPSIPTDKLTCVDPDSPEGKQGVTGKFYPSKDEKVCTRKCYIRTKELEVYKDIVGCRDRSKIPPIALSVYFNKAILSLGSSEFSRARILGMVHLRQRVTVYKNLRSLLESKDNFYVTFLNEEYKMTARGLENTVRTSVWGPTDDLLWEALVSGLSVKPRKGKVKKKSTAKIDEFKVYREMEIYAAADTGMRFARCTEDYQPQHLNWWTARLAGFKSPIAHGLWSMAVAVDRIMHNEQEIFEENFPLHIDVHFKRPLALPGTALLQYDEPREPHHLTNFRMVNPKTMVPILIGFIQAGECPKD